jgi:acetolactate synthase-1/2/3 large subunit
VGAGDANAKTLSMLDLSNPDMNFMQIAQGLGVNASQARSNDEFTEQFKNAMRTPGPKLIEVIL